MTTTVKHAFTDPKADGPDATIARPSDWNADHVVTGASDPTPNLVLNSDFGRRTVLGLAMPELFGDSSAWSSASALSVASNQLTVVTAARVAKWIGPNTMWRDGRWSAQFKAISATGGFMLSKDVDTNDAKTTGSDVEVYTPSGTALALVKQIAGVRTTVASVGITLTLNNWYWIELEAQGTTYIAKIYSSGASPVAKGSATLVNTVSGTIADAAVTSGMISVWSDQANSLWGGIAASPGGVYLETWLPESWAVTHTGTLGGQAIAYDDAADSGPLNKQWTPVVYIPAVSRTMTVQLSGPDGGVLASTAYAYSFYEKTTSLGGSGVMIQGNVLEQNSAQATQATNSLTDAAETSYTRKTGTFTSNAATRRFAFQFLINQGGARTGTVRFSLPQLEQGSAATAWRNASADDAPMMWKLSSPITGLTTTSATPVEVDPRDMAANLFLPWDAVIVVIGSIAVTNSGLNFVRGQIFIDAADVDGITDAMYMQIPVANQYICAPINTATRLAAGKHRVTFEWYTSAGTATASAGMSPKLIVIASRGK